MEAVNYLERAALELVPPATRKPRGQWLNLIFRMRQWIPRQSPTVSRAIYSPSASWQPSTLPEVLRQITWQADQDRKRCKDELVTWPTVTIDYYDISDKEDWNRLDSAIRKLEERFAHFPFDTLGLAATHLDSVEPAPTGPMKVATRRAYVRALYVWMGSGTVQATFRQGVDSGLDSAWDEAWDALSQICRPDWQVEGYQANYLIPPERLSELLVRAVSEEQP